MALSPGPYEDLLGSTAVLRLNASEVLAYPTHLVFHADCSWIWPDSSSSSPELNVNHLNRTLGANMSLQAIQGILAILTVFQLICAFRTKLSVSEIGLPFSRWGLPVVFLCFAIHHGVSAFSIKSPDLVAVIPDIFLLVASGCFWGALIHLR